MRQARDISCRYNKGVVCGEWGRKCSCCGWNPKEEMNRKIRLNSNGFSVNSEGKRFLSLRKVDAQ